MMDQVHSPESGASSDQHKSELIATDTIVSPSCQDGEETKTELDGEDRDQKQSEKNSDELINNGKQHMITTTATSLNGQAEATSSSLGGISKGIITMKDGDIESVLDKKMEQFREMDHERERKWNDSMDQVLQTTQTDSQNKDKLDRYTVESLQEQQEKPVEESKTPVKESKSVERELVIEEKVEHEVENTTTNTCSYKKVPPIVQPEKQQEIEIDNDVQDEPEQSTISSAHSTAKFDTDCVAELNFLERQSTGDPVDLVCTARRESMLQANACVKLQSLWKGHQARKNFQSVSARLHVLEVDQFELRLVDPGILKRIRSHAASSLRFKITVWNLKDNVRTFIWTSKPITLTSSMESQRRIYTKERVLLPGLDKDCVLSVFLVETYRKANTGELTKQMFEASLIDLDTFNDVFLVKMMKEMNVAAKSNYHGPTTNETEPMFRFRVQSRVHGYCGWLWMSRGDAGDMEDEEDLIPFKRKMSLPFPGRRRSSTGNAKKYQVSRGTSSACSDGHNPASSLNCFDFLVHLFSKKGQRIRNQKVIQQQLEAEAKAQLELTNPEPEIVLSDMVQEDSNKDWNWTSFWACVYDGKLFLYDSFGMVEPAIVINTKGAVVSSFLFAKNAACSEFQLEQQNLIQSVQPGHPISKQIEKFSKLHFVAESRSHAVSFVTKLKASALEPPNK